MPDWNDGLTGVALNIAATNDSLLRVLAGPGTGKTFALMRRIARLLQEGSAPERLLVCTFTRTAARDIESELSRLGIAEVARVASGTVHAVCFRVLSRAAVLAITGRVPRPLLRFEERFLLEDLRGEQFGTLHEKRRRLRAFNAAWARLQSDVPGWPANAVDRAFHHELIQWL